MMRVLLLAPLFLFALLAAYFAAGLKRDPSLIPSVLIDRPLPQFDLPPIDGFETGFSSQDATGQVMLINIFGSWCVSCAVEHPMLMEIAANGDVPIAGLDWKDPPGAGAQWLKDNGNPYAMIGDDAEGRTVIDFGVTGAPETFIIDKSGRIRYKQIGPITPQVWREELKPLIEKLQKEGTRAGA